MPVKTVKVYRREDPYTIFHAKAFVDNSPGFEQVAKEFLIKEKRTMVLVDDYTLSITTIWPDHDTLNSFRSNPAVIEQFKRIDDYNQTMNITIIEDTVEETQ
jgi:hypothetical protein